MGEIIKLSPTCEEITAYGDHLYETKHDHGVLTITNGNDYFQMVHDTWYSYSKYGGRVHTDLGCNGYHLMFIKEKYMDFIDFIKRISNNLPKNTVTFIHETRMLLYE